MGPITFVTSGINPEPYFKSKQRSTSSVTEWELLVHFPSHSSQKIHAGQKIKLYISHDSHNLRILWKPVKPTSQTSFHFLQCRFSLCCHQVVQTAILIHARLGQVYQHVYDTNNNSKSIN